MRHTINIGEHCQTVSPHRNSRCCNGLYTQNVADVITRRMKKENLRNKLKSLPTSSPHNTWTKSLHEIDMPVGFSLVEKFQKLLSTAPLILTLKRHGVGGFICFFVSLTSTSDEVYWYCLLQCMTLIVHVTSLWAMYKMYEEQISLLSNSWKPIQPPVK